MGQVSLPRRYGGYFTNHKKIALRTSRRAIDWRYLVSTTWQPVCYRPTRLIIIIIGIIRTGGRHYKKHFIHLADRAFRLMAPIIARLCRIGEERWKNPVYLTGITLFNFFFILYHWCDMKLTWALTRFEA
jgi:hypothetical protein